MAEVYYLVVIVDNLEMEARVAEELAIMEMATADRAVQQILAEVVEAAVEMRQLMLVETVDLEL